MDKSVYSRPDKTKTMVVTSRWEPSVVAVPDVPEILTVDKYTECHVTPQEVAKRMVSYLGRAGGLTLEPSAGTGNLLQALFDSGHLPCELVAIERHIKLCSEISKRFKGQHYLDPICECFLEYAEKAKGKTEFPRILMNPPFKKVRQHMEVALSLLGNDGHDCAVLVALVPITYQHDNMETLEKLSRGTFSTAQVETKIIRFEYE